MSLETEFRFRANKKLFYCQMKVQGCLVTVTVPDGRKKSAQIGGNTPETVAHLLTLELYREKRWRSGKPAGGYRDGRRH